MFMVVEDDALPAGHEWMRVRCADGHSVTFIAASSLIIQLGHLVCDDSGIPVAPTSRLSP